MPDVTNMKLIYSLTAYANRTHQYSHSPAEISARSLPSKANTCHKLLIWEKTMTGMKCLFRRHLIPGLMTNVFFIYGSLTLSLLHAEDTAGCSPISIGNRRELFVDNWLIGDLRNAQRRLHQPVAREIAIVHDQPWEGNVCYYHTVFRDAARLGSFPQVD